MLDQIAPPFRAGDVAYTARAPGGYGSAAAVPTDAAFSGNDKAYTAPSLGGEFQPGSGMAAPTSSPISKGADADGGAADIANTPRIGAPPAPSPPPAVPLACTVNGNWLVFNGAAAANVTVTVTYTPPTGAPSVTTQAVLAGDSAAVVATKVAAKMQSAQIKAQQTSNGILVLTSDGETPPGTFAV